MSVKVVRPRFSRASLLDTLRERARTLREYNGWDPNNGTAQLWPRGCDQATQTLVNKAAAYGEWRAICSLIDEFGE